VEGTDSRPTVTAKLSARVGDDELSLDLPKAGSRKGPTVPGVVLDATRKGRGQDRGGKCGRSARHR